MGVTSLGCHTRPACTQGFTRSLKLCEECRFNSCVRVFFIPMGSRGLKQWVVTSISHMGEMRDSDWSRKILLRSDWLLPSVAICTTAVVHRVDNNYSPKWRWLAGGDYLPRPRVSIQGVPKVHSSNFMHYNFWSKIYFYMKFPEDVYFPIENMYSEFQ